MNVDDVALAHLRQQAKLARIASDAIVRMWMSIDTGNLSTAWADQTPAATAVLTAAQISAANEASPYVTASLAAQRTPVPPDDLDVIPAAFGGTASDGRSLESLLMEAPIAAKSTISRGGTIERAMTAGATWLDMMIRTQVADAGRAAVGVSITSRPQVSGYVRMLSPPSCSRCIVLAGRFYRWNAGFLRHPRCDCRHIPVAEDNPDDPRTDPMKYFRSLSKAEQNEVFGIAGAQAVHDGADISQVVNARRKGGMYTAGGRRYTRESTTKRGILKGRQRLTPDQIYADAGSDREAAVELLKANGYLGPQAIREARTVVLHGEPALKAARASIASGESRAAPGLSKAEWSAARKALVDYRGVGFNGINTYLRTAEQVSDAASRVAAIDRAMAASRLRYDVVVYRGVASVERTFGLAAEGDMTGLQWHEKAYMSTSTNRFQARQFADPGGTHAAVLEIHVRAGTGAVLLSGQFDQAELLLQRDLKPRVVADRGIVDGFRYLVVEIP